MGFGADMAPKPLQNRRGFGLHFRHFLALGAILGPRWLQDHPKSSQNLSKMPPGPPKMAPRSPKWSQDGPRTPLTWSQDASQDLQLEDKNQSRSNKTKTSKQSTTYNSQWARPVAAAGAVDPAAPLIVLRVLEAVLSKPSMIE